MKIQFNVEYCTIDGEALWVNFPADGGAAAESLRMTSADGRLWTCETSRTAGKDGFVDYFYSVTRDGQPYRHEWLVAPHRLAMAAKRASKYMVWDKWTDIPEDAHLYSAAYTRCVAARKAAKAKAQTGGERTVVLKVRAPQLRSGQRLALLGGDKAVGSWVSGQAVAMTEQQPGEWMAALDTSQFASGEFEYKFVAVGGDKAAGLLWELGANRTFRFPHIDSGEAVVCELAEARFPIAPWRAAGTVVPVFSLRSEGSFGVGDFGDLRLMVDWVAKTGQEVLQLLPVNDSTVNYKWTDSYPYNTISIYALHPQYADFRQLPELKNEAERKRFEALRKELNALPAIDYGRMIAAKMDYLRQLYAQEGQAAMRTKQFKDFFARNAHWLVPYAAFCHLRDTYGTADFNRWPDNNRMDKAIMADYGNPRTKAYKAVAFWYYVQYVLDAQLKAAHDHARDKHVVLKGDIPIGISRHGVDAWTQPELFNMAGQTGAPPDAYSDNGQNWGFPTYNWDAMMADGCSWWVARFRKMAEYFDAYRIDHVLGFFRIWEIPAHSVHGILGQFVPSRGMTQAEIEAYGLPFREEEFTKPYITDDIIGRVFGDKAASVAAEYLEKRGGNRYAMRPEYDTQRKVEAAFAGKQGASSGKQGTFAEAEGGGAAAVRDGLYRLISDVLFVRDRDDARLYHPRVAVQSDFVYEMLADEEKNVFNRLYDDYYYRRNDALWRSEALRKLSLLTQSTGMLPCAEDLGMVPSCVPGTLNDLRILSLEIQSMPKEYGVRFGHLSRNPYRSVCTIFTHDMPTLRQWWDEDPERTQDYYRTMLHRGGSAPHPLPGWLAKDIVARHLLCPSMLCLVSLQDWLSISEQLRRPDMDSERINVPANPHNYWHYRMHLTIEQLIAATDFNESIRTLVGDSGRL